MALDDLGAGYATLSMLGTLRPDIIKLDRDLVSDVDRKPFKASVIRHILDLARENGIEVLAEGVERIEEVAWLTSQQVDYMQGYYFARPGPEPVGFIERRTGV